MKKILFIIIAWSLPMFFVFAASSATLDNPLKWDTLEGAVAGIMSVIVKVGAIAVILAFIWVGWLYVKAQGAPKDIEAAHKAFQYTVIGALVLLGADVIANLIAGTVKTIQK
jgi:hypothetical protein